MSFDRDEVLRILKSLNGNLNDIKYSDPCAYDWEVEDAKGDAIDNFYYLVKALGFEVETDKYLGNITEIY